jgi:hypothetical protein
MYRFGPIVALKAQTQSGPEGGIPSGPLEVLGRLETGVVCVADLWRIGRVFPADVVYCFICFVGEA